MAIFKINIKKEIIPPYIPNLYKVDTTNCIPLDKIIPIGLLEESNTPNISFLFSNYTGNSWSKLNISSIEYSNQSFYLEYNGSKLLSNSGITTEIDISTVLVNQSIPNLNIVSDNITLTENIYIKFTINIEDSNGAFGGEVDFYYYIIVNDCLPEEAIEVITVLSTNESNCLSEVTIRVNVPIEESRYVYATLTPVYGSINGSYTTFTPIVITSSTQYILKLEGDKTANNNHSHVTIFVKNDISSVNIMDYKTLNRDHSNNIC